MKRLARVYSTAAVLLLNTLLLLVVIEGCSGVALALGVRPQRLTLAQRIEQFKQGMLGLSYYAGVDWARGYWDEHMQVADHWGYHPYTIWRTQPFSGQHLNVDADGLRVTPGADCATARYRIALFGGSAMWGYGSPDAMTIPAQVQALLAGQGVCVVNRADVGFNSTQNVIQLAQMLQAGDVPDLVIFYDGSNDLSAAQRTGVPGAHFYVEDITPVVRGGFVWDEYDTPPSNPLRDWLRGTATFRLLVGDPLPAPPNWAQPPFDPAFVDGVTDIYLSNVRLVEALAREYGFDFVAFVQPALPVTARAVTPEEQRFLWDMPGGLPDLFRAVYPRWQTAADADPDDALVYFGAALDDELTLPMWIDFNHLTPWGNLAMADRIVRVMTPLIDLP